MITVSFHSFLRLELNCKELDLAEDTIEIHDLLRICENKLQHPFLDKMLGGVESNQFHRPMILLNGRNVTQLKGMKTVAVDGDLVTLLPPCGGG